jgi:hypothetical protein
MLNISSADLRGYLKAELEVGGGEVVQATHRRYELQRIRGRKREHKRQ